MRKSNRPGISRSLVAVVALVLVLVAGGCVRCQPGTTKCDGNAAIACLSNGMWQRFLDCNQVTPPGDGGAWVCCDVQQPASRAGATCLPAKECR
jgi:hypothetical protein